MDETINKTFYSPGALFDVMKIAHAQTIACSPIQMQTFDSSTEPASGRVVLIVFVQLRRILWINKTVQLKKQSYLDKLGEKLLKNNVKSVSQTIFDKFLSKFELQSAKIFLHFFASAIISLQDCCCSKRTVVFVWWTF